MIFLEVRYAVLLFHIKKRYIFGLVGEALRQAMAMKPPNKGMQNGPYQESKHNC